MPNYVTSYQGEDGGVGKVYYQPHDFYVVRQGLLDAGIKALPDIKEEYRTAVNLTELSSLCRIAAEKIALNAGGGGFGKYDEKREIIQPLGDSFKERVKGLVPDNNYGGYELAQEIAGKVVSAMKTELLKYDIGNKKGASR